MVFKRYIKRGGKKFGPYFYESKRIKGKIKSIYVGSARNKELIKKYGTKKTKTEKHKKITKKMQHKPKKTLTKNTSNKTKHKKTTFKNKTKQKIVTKPKKIIQTIKPLHKFHSKKKSTKAHTLKTKTKKTTHKPEELKISKPKKLNLIGKSKQELLNTFNNYLMQTGKTIALGSISQSIENYEQLVHIYNKLKQKLTYEDSMKIYNTIKLVFQDIKSLKQEAL